MPIIVVLGLPADLSEEAMLSLSHDLSDSVAAVEELGLTEGQVTVFMPSDGMSLGSGEEIIIFVEGLFVRPERTDEVRAWLAEGLGVKVKGRFPDALVEVFVRPFDPKQGFWTSKKEADHAGSAVAPQKEEDVSIAARTLGQLPSG